jgi:hypothetical protein
MCQRAHEPNKPGQRIRVTRPADPRSVDKPPDLSNVVSMIRPLLIGLLTSLLVACSTTSQREVSTAVIKEILPRNMTEEQFVRIQEYRTGTEYTGNRLIVRTDPKERDGFYFVLILDTKVRRLPQGTVIQGEFYSKAAPQKQRYDFPLPADRPKSKSIFLGLTGEAWPHSADKDVVPSAWRFQIIGPNGEIFGEKASYLWDQ